MYNKCQLTCTIHCHHTMFHKLFNELKVFKVKMIYFTMIFNLLSDDHDGMF